jgi:serine/threonine protein kinase
MTFQGLGVDEPISEETEADVLAQSDTSSTTSGVAQPIPPNTKPASFSHKPSPLSIPDSASLVPPSAANESITPRMSDPARASTMPVHEAQSVSRKSSTSRPAGHSLMRKLSGIHLFSRNKDRHAAADSPGPQSPLHSAEGDKALHQATSARNNLELVHPKTKDVSMPAESLRRQRSPSGSLQTTPSHQQNGRPMFSVGDSRGVTPSATPGASRGPSRQSSIAEHNPENGTPSSASSLHGGMGGGVSNASTSAQQTMKSSVDSAHASPTIADALNDDPDFMPKPVRSRSTFGFWSKDKTPAAAPADVRRVSSFSHKANDAPAAVDIPGRSRSGTGQSMADLSRTLSKTSLARGAGWGAITGQLPKFDHLYVYQEADAKLLKLPKKGAKGQVGEGAGGLVRTARLKSGKRPQYHAESRGGDLGLFAVKTFARKREKEDEGFYCAKLVREFRVHCALSHTNIVKLADICVEDHKFGEQSFVAVMDYCIGGDLFDLHYHAYNAIDQGVMGKAEKNCVYKQLMFAVNYMHQQGIAHRDIKLENMLMSGHGQLKLADFGTSVFVSGPDAEECRGIVGTDHSIPPEAYLSGSKEGPAYDGLKADIWACACVFHFLTWENDSPVAALNAYPFGGEGADPRSSNKNKAWAKYVNNLKRYEPERFLPGYEGGDIMSPSSVPGTPISRQNSEAPSTHSSEGFPNSYVSKHTYDSHGEVPLDDCRDPLRKKAPFCRLPASSFTSMKGMLDPNPDTRWTAEMVLQDKFFDLIDCCQQDSNSYGYKPSAARHKKKHGQNKVHNHIRPGARKLMESNSVEQERHQDQVNEMRSAQP